MRDVTISVMASVTLTGGGNLRRHEVQPFVYLTGGEKGLGASKPTVVLYVSSVLTSKEGNSSKELRGKWLKVTFEFACMAVADEVLGF